jgi:4-hydroxybenzoate polyprenyltransferase
MAFWKRLRLTLEMIKFEHSVFALPFALTGALLAFRESHFDARGFGYKLLWIAIAMVGARSAAMAFNRILDADIDARNPRTRLRHIPAGILSVRFAWGFVLLPFWCSCSRRARSIRCASSWRRWRWPWSSSTRSPSASPRSRT